MTLIRPRYALHTPFVCAQPSSAEPAHLQQNSALLAVLAILLLFSLGACSAGSSPTPVQSHTPVPTATQISPTPTSLPKGTVLYRADWSHGPSGWQSSPSWKLTQGYFQSDTGMNATLTAPYMPTVPNYAIEVRLQVVSVPHGSGSFLITADRAAGKDGYQASVLDIREGPRPDFSHPQAQIYIDPLSSMEP